MIKRFPELPDEILQAVNNEKLVVFIGAGVSRLIGCKSWAQIAKGLVEKCFRTTKKDDSKLINYKEKENLINNNDYKKIITICHFLLKNNGYEKEFYRELKKLLTADEELLKKIKIYDELIKLRGMFITTNADTYFDDNFEKIEVFYKEKGLIKGNIKNNRLFKIHGTIGNGSKKYWNSLIFTVPKYIERYNSPDFKNFLKKIFDNYTILFIGYGLGEFEILDFLIEKVNSKRKELKHFILLPFYKEEENILKFEKSYYNQLGIQVIAYEKDERGYEQLYEVIKQWNKKINAKSNYLYKSYDRIDSIVNSFDEKNIEEIFQIVKNDKAQENYFFQQLANSSNPFPWLKILDSKKYFEPQKNPKPEVDNKGFYKVPQWNILNYLENVVEKNKEKPDTKITKTLLEIIDKIINYRDKSGGRIENYRTDWIIVKIIFSLPAEKISKKHIEFLKTIFNYKTSTYNTVLVSAEIGKSVLLKLLEGKRNDLIVDLLKIILNYKKVETNGITEYVSIVDGYWFKEALSKHKKEIARLCGDDAAKIAISKIESIMKEDGNQFNLIWIPAIEDSVQTSFPDRYDCQMVYFVRDMLENSKAESVENLIKELLDSKYPIFRRIAIHIINYHYDKLNNLFWSLENPIDDFHIKHELYELFKKRSSIFSNEQIEKVINWIENSETINSKKSEKTEEDHEKFVAYFKKGWLSSFLESKNNKVLSLYNEYNKISPEPLRHFSFNFYTSDISSKEENENIKLENEILSKITSKKISEYLKDSVKTTNYLEDLAHALRNAAFKYPEIFTESMQHFLQIPCIYQNAIINGLYNCLEDRDKSKQIPWNNVFNFIYDLISQGNFCSDNSNEENNWKNWIIFSICGLIEGLIEEKLIIKEYNLGPKIEKILLILSKKIIHKDSKPKDFISSFLNSSDGKLFSIIIKYSLSYKIFWMENVKEDFSKRLKVKINSSFNFYTAIGKYLNEIYKLDQNWVKDNVNEIFPKDKMLWEAAFTGYLYPPSIPEKELYFLLAKNYNKGIKTKFKNENISKRLVQHICWAYLGNWEEEKNKMIYKLIENNREDQILAIIDFFLFLRDEISNKVKEKGKIKPIWKKLYETLKQNKSKYEKAISKLSLWLNLINRIDGEILEYLKFSVKYIDIYRDAPFLIKYSLEHVSKTPSEIGDIYIEMLKANKYPDYEESDIINIIQTLYEKGEKKKADMVCNLYGKNGSFFLKSLYKKYNNLGDFDA